MCTPHRATSLSASRQAVVLVLCGSRPCVVAGRTGAAQVGRSAAQAVVDQPLDQPERILNEKQHHCGKRAIVVFILVFRCVYVGCFRLLPCALLRRRLAALQATVAAKLKRFLWRNIKEYFNASSVPSADDQL